MRERHGRVEQNLETPNAEWTYTVTPDENILDVAGKFLMLKVRRFPVLENGKLVGQVSQRGVMRALDVLQHRTV